MTSLRLPVPGLTRDLHVTFYKRSRVKPGTGGQHVPDTD